MPRRASWASRRRPDSEEAKRPFVEVSGRKGLGVKADDLIDRVLDKATAEVQKRIDDLPDAEQREISEAERRRIAELIGIAAVRYFMIKYSRTKGDRVRHRRSGQLSQAKAARTCNTRSCARTGSSASCRNAKRFDARPTSSPSLPSTPPDALLGAEGDHELWNLVLEAARLDDVVEQVVRSLEFAVLAKYGFGLAQLFSALYQNPRASILNEERDDVRRWRAAAVSYVTESADARSGFDGRRRSPKNVSCSCRRLRSRPAAPWLTTWSRSDVPAASPLELTHDRDTARRRSPRVHGLMLTGGGDVDPRLYGEEPHATFQPSEAGPRRVRDRADSRGR